VRVADGEPAHDTQLSVLSAAESEFMQKKLAMAALVGDAGTAVTTGSTAGKVVPMYACEFDPCEDPNPPAWPPASGPSVAKTLGTKARQQNNNYFCGPASGQVVINWTRGIISGNNDGEDATTNWRRQSKIAEWMKTTSTSGTSGANLAVGLNNANAVAKPTTDWVYAYDNNGSMQELYDKIVTDVDGFGMPLVLATAPYVSGAGAYHLKSWPRPAPGAHHWIVIRGYDATAGSTNPIIRYQDSSAGYGGSTGAFDDSLAVIWQVSAWNQGGHVVW
jgi:hypothetical protein